MLEKITKQSLFSRKLSNEGKAGAYYTDLQHCEWIGKLLSFPSEEVCCLEPSIGNGKAIKQVIGNVENAKIFGVELNHGTVAEYEKEDNEVILEADFLNGVKISHNSFSFCFSNPPYGEDDSVNRQRYERLFLEKLTPYLMNEAVLVYVIPYYVYAEQGFTKLFYSRYTVLECFRFHESEYKKFQQIVVIGRKKRNPGLLKDEFDKYYETINDLSKIKELPTDYSGKRIEVKSSNAENVEYFCSKIFNPEIGFSYLEGSPLFSVLGKKLEEKQFISNKIDNPPIPLKKDMLYLLAVSGGGQGLAGNVESGDLHLQRGTVKRIATSTYEPKGEDGVKEVVRETSAICLSIIESNGTITHFEN